MLKKLFGQITKERKVSPTYQIGLVHSKTYRIYKQITTTALKKYNLSFVDWLLLGLLYDAGEMRYGVLAETLGVEASFVSVLVEQLRARGYIREKKSTSDKRVKQIILSKKGLSLIPDVEEHLKSKISRATEGVPLSEMQKYMETIQMLEDTQSKS
jgi:DNA-binding MarR family transcriptional regulator